MSHSPEGRIPFTPVEREVPTHQRTRETLITEEAVQGIQMLFQRLRNNYHDLGVLMGERQGDTVHARYVDLSLNQQPNAYITDISERITQVSAQRRDLRPVGIIVGVTGNYYDAKRLSQGYLAHDIGYYAASGDWDLIDNSYPTVGGIVRIDIDPNDGMRISPVRINSPLDDIVLLETTHI